MFQKSIKSRLGFFCLVAMLAFLIAGNTKAATIFGVTTTNQLVRFDSTTPANVTTIGTISGIQAGENILGIDFRPATGQLFALGSTSRIYTINFTTGAATQVGTTPFTPALSGTSFGFDFNPTVDRIRVVSNTGISFRLNPNDGTLAGTDTSLNPGTPNISAVAYNNNFNGTTATTLYGIDATSSQLVLIGGVNGTPSPNLGTVQNVAPLGVAAGSNVAFDVLNANPTGFAAIQLNGEAFSRLYSINLFPAGGSNAATALGQIGSGILLRSIAVTFRAPIDFDGDRRTDFAVHRPAQNLFIALNSGNGVFTGRQFGLVQNDTNALEDYDGDGKTDIAVFRNTGVFYVLRSSDNTAQIQNFGANFDQPVSHDYDGDGKADFAVVRTSGTQLIWFILNSSNSSVRTEQWGNAGDVVTPGDYDGDGKYDLAVKRGAVGQPASYFIKQSSGPIRISQWGLNEDLAVPGDYDGDGRTDLAVVRTGSSYIWYVLRSSDNSVFSVQFGAKGHLTTQGDYDGDGRTDVSTWANGVFYVLRTSNNGVTQLTFGQPSDIPVANFDTH